MTLRFVDSFDHYVTADLTEKWTNKQSSPIISASNGRRSTACLRCNAGVVNYMIKTIDAQATWTVGFAFKCAALPTSAVETLLQLVDGSTVHVALRLKSNGTMEATRSTTVLGTTTFALSAGGYYYIEFKAFIHDTTGTVEIKVDGSSKLALTSQDTRNAGNASADLIRLGQIGTTDNATYDFDDVYVCDGAGAVNNSFLGDCRVDYYAANGNGNSSQLDGSDGNQTDNYLLVDDRSPDDDTTYVQSADVSDKDTYTCADMTHTPSSIFGVQQIANAKKDDAGARSLANVTRSGGTDYDGATQALSTAYLYYMDIKEVDPNTSAAWTKANLNAAEFGVKVAA